MNQLVESSTNSQRVSRVQAPLVSPIDCYLFYYRISSVVLNRITFSPFFYFQLFCVFVLIKRFNLPALCLRFCLTGHSIILWSCLEERQIPKVIVSCNFSQLGKKLSVISRALVSDQVKIRFYKSLAASTYIVCWLPIF